MEKLRTPAVLLFLSSFASTAQSFDVVGWYVGDNLTNWPMEELNWNVYSTIRIGGVVVAENGTALGCDFSNPAFVEALRVARLHGKTVTLGANFGYCKWKDTNVTTQGYCKNYLRTLGAAVRSCGPNIAGMEFDHEGDDEKGPFGLPAKYWGRAGLVSKEEAHWFTQLMDDMQKSMGDNYTVSEDIGVWGFGGVVNSGDTYPLNLLTPWVDAEIIKKNPQLYVNTMSYHWPTDCSDRPWKRDAYVVNEVWGIPKSQINIGIGFYTRNHTGVPGELPWKFHGEPTWETLSKQCPDVPESTCKCDGIYFSSKQECMEVGQLVREEGFRGVFPWAANYDSRQPADSLIRYVGLGLGLVNASTH
eukprot:Hpha_TRINITY_DN13980_c0_g1::TRINITY_DN13980_c0_g1_i1::g.35885::m.35885